MLHFTVFIVQVGQKSVNSVIIIPLEKANSLCIGIVH